MNHQAAIELLPLYSLDALGLADALAVEIHLARCDVCQEELAGYARVAVALSGEMEPRPGVWPSILRRIEFG